MQKIWQDVRYGVRTLAKSPGFAAVAVISLALAIGANTAVFSLYNSLMLKPLPVPHPGQLRVLTWRGDIRIPVTHCRVFLLPTGETSGNVVSYPLYRALREKTTDVADLFAFSEFSLFDPLTVEAGAETFTAPGLIVSGNFFEGLGLRAHAGRTIAPNDDRSEEEPVAVISYAAWQRCFKGDPQAIGQTVFLNRHGFTIIGVLPRGFLGPVGGNRGDFYVPMSAQALVRPDCPLAAARPWWVQVMARLSPGADEEQFATMVNGLFTQAVTDAGLKGSDKPVRMVVEDGSGGPREPRQSLTKTLPILMGIVGIILLVACANLASLLLARGASRQQEMAVRAALGAGRGRLTRQCLTESLIVSSAGAAGGLLLAVWARQILLRMFWPSQVVVDLRSDGRVLGFTTMICVASALLFGLLPALRSSRVQPAAFLKERASGGLSRMRVGRCMVAIQTALSLLLLVGAGLFVRTVMNLYHVETGFNADRLLVFQLDGGKTGLEGRRLVDCYEQIRASIAGLPGVRGVTSSNILLLSRWMNNSQAKIAGRAQDEEFAILGLSVSDSFLSTMGIPLLLGRDLSAADDATARKVVLVNQTLARRAFPGENPVGRVLTINQNDYEIAGVFGDIVYADLKKAVEPTVFYSYRQTGGQISRMFYEVRTAADPLALVPAIRNVVSGVDRTLPMADVKTQAIQLDESISQERSFAMLASGLALMAVLLSCIGLYSLMAYSVSHRTGEIGIRMALGATPRNVAWPILRGAFLTGAVGIALGLPAVAAGTRIVRSYLFGVEPRDPVTVAVAAVSLLAIAVLAAWIPARRAMRIDPMTALRCE
ncbi:MAG: ABC transporter permease [Phycisphaerales bacterium]